MLFLQADGRPMSGIPSRLIWSLLGELRLCAKFVGSGLTACRAGTGDRFGRMIGALIFFLAFVRNGACAWLGGRNGGNGSIVRNFDGGR